MNYRTKINLGGLILCLLFLLFVKYYENYYESNFKIEAKSHCSVIERSLWDLYPETTQKYFEQIIDKLGYEFVEIRNADNQIFVKVVGDEPVGLEKFLIDIGLVRLSQIKLDVYHKQDVVGVLHIGYRNTSIYLYMNVLLILILFFGVYVLFLKVLKDKSLLAIRVQERTDELHQMVLQLKEGEEKYKAIFDHANDAILLLQNGVVVECNQKTFEMFKMSFEDILNKNLADFSGLEKINGIKSSVLLEKYLKEIESGSTKRLEWLFQRKDNSIFETEITANIVMLKGQKYQQCIIRDVSESRAFEKQLRHSEKIQAIGQLAGGIAHEFNNVLAGVLGCANMIRKTNLEPNAVKFLQLMTAAVQRATSLTGKLLSFSRTGGEVQFNIVKVTDIINSVTGLLSYTIDKSIRIDFVAHTENDKVMGDASALENVFLNMGINSAHAMPQGGVLTFKLYDCKLDKHFCNQFANPIEEGDYLVVEVKDNGLGISPENLSKIFDPFFTTKEVGKGTGLGLSSAFGTIQSHGGAITVESEENVGTLFKVYLPLTVSMETFSKQSTTLPRGSGSILLVDDEELIRITVASTLNDLGYSVIEAKDGKEAIMRFAENIDDIALVILDMQMPGLTGREVFERMLMLKKKIKVIISSGYAREDEFNRMKELGVSDFLLKPYTDEDLSNKIASVLSRP